MDQFDFTMIHLNNMPKIVSQCERESRCRNAVESFVKFLQLSLELNDPKWRAYCWYWMGQCVAMNLDLNPLELEDGGIFYYRKAIKEDPDCAHAWASVIVEYTAEPWGHHDKELAEQAIRFFLQSNGIWPPELLSLINNKADIYGLQKG